MAGASNSITTHNVLSGVLNADNVISGLVNTAFNPAYALVTQAGAQIVLFINSNDYKMYAQLKDKSGNLIYTSNIIDLPLETMVVDGRYDSNTKKLILVLDNGNEIEVPLEALINGLVNEDDLIANYYDKDEIDALLNGYWTKIELTQEDIDNWNAKQEYLNQGDGIEISADTILKGNTRQESTTGKNLLNIFNFEMGSISNGNIMSSPYRINNVNNPIEVKPNTTYCISSVLSTQVKGMRCGIHECDENMTFKKDSGWQQLATNPYVFTTENYTKYVKIVFTLSTTSTDVQTNITEDVTSYNNAVDWARGCLFQLEEGNTATSWEPYTGGNPAPNPDYPYPVNVVTGDNEVKIEGKNLYNKAISTFNGYLANDGAETASANYKTSDYIQIEPNTTYATGVMTNPGSNPSRCYYDENKTFISGEKHFGATTVTGTSPSNAKYMRESIPVVDIDNVMIYKGTTPTTYEPYVSQTYPINLGSMELCKIGDYQDYLYKENGIWYKYGAIGKKTFNGTEEYTQYSTTNKFHTILDNALFSSDVTIKCDKYLGQTSGGGGSDYANYTCWLQNTSNYKRIYFRNDSCADASAFTTFMSNNNATVIYPLETPTTTEITDTNLISQLNALTTGFSNKWIKNISQTNAEIPFELEYDNTNLTISASSNLVRNTDYATSQTGGVIKVGNAGININNNGYIYAGTLNYTQYNSADNSTFVGKGTLENVITGKELTNKTYVDAADAVFESELFDDGIISVEDVTEANIDNTMNKSQLKIDLKGNTTQESTTGINLFCPDAPSKTQNGITVTNNGDDTFTISGTATNNVAISLTTGSKGKELIGSQAYTLAVDIISNGGSRGSITCEIDKNGTTQYNFFSIAPEQATGMKVQVSTPSEDATIKDITYYVANGLVVNNLKIRPYLVKGSYTASNVPDYEPYTGGTPAPNPDTPIPVNVVTGDNEVKVEGKNLLPNTLTNLKTINTNGTWTNNQYAYGGITYIINDDMSIIANGTASSTSQIGIDFYPDLSKTYIVSGVSNGSSTTYRIIAVYYDSNNAYISETAFIDNEIQLNIPNNTAKVRVFCRVVGGATVNNIIFKPMIRLSSIIDATYEEHKEQTYPINLGSMELCKIGDYQDRIFKSSGKNLFNISNLNSTNFTNAIIGSNTITLTGTNDYHSTVTGTNLGDIADLEIGKTYTLTFDTTYTGNNKNKIFLRGSQSYWESGTSLTMTQEMLNDRFAFYGTNNAVVSNIMIRLSNISDTSYEPYGKVWYKYGAIRKIVLDGSENWSNQAGAYDTETRMFFSVRISGVNANINNRKGISNYFINSNVSVQDKYVDITAFNFHPEAQYSNYIYIKIDKNQLSSQDATGFKNWLSNHNTIVYCQLTPTYTKITDSTLVSQLNNLEKSISYDTQTNISQTNNDMPFIINAEAIADNVNGLKLENENQEYKTNKVIELSSNSTDDEYPSAKCVYDIVGNIEAVLAAMDSGSGV